MPESPTIKFQFENNNIQASVPTLGISHVVARTTKGPFEDPSKLLSNYQQFVEIFGKEIVPDGSVSNIERAFALGSTLRVSRVKGGSTPVQGEATIYSQDEPPLANLILDIHLINPKTDEVEYTLQAGVKTRGYGDSIVKPSLTSNDRKFYLNFQQQIKGNVCKTYLIQTTTIPTETPKTSDILASTLVNVSNISLNGYTDLTTFEGFLANSPNVQLIFKACTEASVTNLEQFIALAKANPELILSFNEATTFETPITNTYGTITEGSDGGSSTDATWLSAYKAMMDYVDGYNLVLSHIHQHLPATWQAATKAVADSVVSVFESMLLVEIPKYKADGTPNTVVDIVTLIETLKNSIGSAYPIAYFCGGIKFYSSEGALRDNDVLGTVLGLSDSSAANYGPWLSFAGMNRGLVTDSSGPVMKNLGSPSLYDELNELAENSINLFVIKDTPIAGRQTMLWHNFTSEPLSNSDRFISSVRLKLYLKKNIRPIFEKYIEEPNNVNTWRNIYYEVKPLVDALMPDAMTEYTWIGDQYATSYNDMQLNTEADVRQGKYKARMSYKDVVSMQIVELTFTVDSSTGSIEID